LESVEARAIGINDAGQVVGSLISEDGSLVGVIWQNGEAMDLGYLSTFPSCAIDDRDTRRAVMPAGINKHGQVAGVIWGFGDGITCHRTFLWNGSMIELPLSSVSDINDMGQVVGTIGTTTNNGGFFPTTTERAAVWHNGSTFSLPGLPGAGPGAQGRALAANNVGQVVGISWGDEGIELPLLWQNRIPTELPRLTDDEGSCMDNMDVNDAGLVVGTLRLGCSRPQAVIWENGEIRKLPNLTGGTMSEAYRINNAGQVVGTALGADEEWYAVVWENRIIKKLNKLPGASRGSAAGINNLGQIAGSSGDHAVLWAGSGGAATPPPPPAASDPGATPKSDEPVTVKPNEAVGLTFGSVSGAGTTTVAVKSIGEGSSPPAPVGFQLGDPPTYYDIKTTATFSGKVLVCIDYASVQFTDQSQLKLLHYEINNGIGAWEDITTSVKTATKQLCGETTSFSPFLVAQKRYPFTGFLRPLESTSLNTVKAGSGVPIRFGLGGNRGLQIFQTGYPLSRSVSCEGTMASGTVAETVTVTAGKSALSYDASTNQYIYAWQTDKAWAGSCRELVMRLVDGSEHKLRFKFTR
jgi:uncharacterized membrane protein